MKSCNRALRLISAIAGSLAVGVTTAIAAPGLSFTRTTAANAPGRVIYTYSVVDDSPEPASYAVELGWVGVGSSVIVQSIITDGEDPCPSVNVRSGWSTSAERNNDTWVFDANFPVVVPGENPFGTGDFNSTLPGDFIGYHEALRPNSYAIAVATAAPVTSGTALVQVVATGDLAWTGQITRNGVRGPVITSGDVPTPEPYLTLRPGGTAPTVIQTNGSTFPATVITTYPVPPTTAVTTFGFVGGNPGNFLIGFDLDLGAATLAEALGSALGRLIVNAGANAPFPAEYDVYLPAADFGGAPYNLAFNLGGGATMNAVAVVPEPAGPGMLAAGVFIALPLRRRRSAEKSAI